MLTKRRAVGRRPDIVLAMVFVAVLAASPACSADDAMAGWLALYRKQADSYEFKPIGDGENSTPRRLDDPVLRWSQPVRIGEDGLLYLWVSQGRPTAAVAIFSFKGADSARSIVHECSSLAATGLSVKWNGKIVWHPEAPAIAFQPMPDAPAPANTAPARLRQMQAMARGFSAKTVRGGRGWDLRLLPKPLYRYEPREAKLLDGALFALAQGTDPEMFLLLEAQADPARWNYAIARFSDLELHVRHNDREVFSVPYSTGGPDRPYLIRVVARKNSETPADFETQ